MKTLRCYPTLTKALMMMAYDNGCVNRETTEDDVRETADKALNGRPDTDAQLSFAEAELSLLEDDDLFTVCCGDQDEVVVKSLSPISHTVLTGIFEAL